MKISLSYFLILVVTVLLVGCSGEKSEEAAAPAAPKPFDPMSIELTDADLIKGREVWMPTCGGCHITGLGGAPKIGDKAAWADRIAKGKEVLYDHAINGFSGPLMLEMPPKGGYDYLTDEEVKLAVDFVVYATSQ